MKMLRFIATAALLTVPAVVLAGPVTVNTGVNTTIPQILQGIVDLILRWSSLIATAIFLLGAILMVGSGGNDALLSAGKRLMKASLIGLAIVLASWMILSTVVALVAG